MCSVTGMGERGSVEAKKAAINLGEAEEQAKECKFELHWHLRVYDGKNVFKTRAVVADCALVSWNVPFGP
jgi:hypothetical protein